VGPWLPFGRAAYLAEENQAKPNRSASSAHPHFAAGLWRSQVFAFSWRWGIDFRVMNTRIVLLFASCATTCLFTAWGSEAPGQSSRPAIYDESADGGKQIAAALGVAKSTNKRVLLQFGANWCGWCHRLHGLLESDPEIAAALKESFVVVLVDVNKGHNAETDKQYGHPIAHGLPVIVILDSNGKQLVTKDTGELEEGDHHSPQKVLAFLKEWAGKKV
jgi:thiol:disulfide interchange protein